ncbi:MAG: hypothetical protein IPP29_13275 [Bacteroidetes bacterium]|nr:hypothetical protein [Bacteroidota bacterium]
MWQHGHTHCSRISSKDNNGQGIILYGITGIPPHRNSDTCAGTVGEYAARAAMVG